MGWMIYGANGYTGTLIAEEAVRRGHRPVLAGRSREKVAVLAERLGLSATAFGLDDPAAVARAVQGQELVLHVAGPFVFTSRPMVRACLEAGASYLDVTGEIPVFQSTFAADAEAKQREVCLMSGVGFDVIPTDCMARYVADKVPGATRLEIAFAAIGAPSAGTAKSALELLPKGNFVRRGGSLVAVPPAHEIREVRFPDRTRTVMSIPWGDLETAYRSTGIGDITTYMAQPPRAARITRAVGPTLARLLSVAPLRAAALKVVERTVKGPEPEARRAGKSFVWVRASGEGGAEAEAWLETIEGYEFTAIGAVRSVEKTLELRPKGALTPAQAFGADFVLEVPGTRRFDRLPS